MGLSYNGFPPSGKHLFNPVTKDVCDLVADILILQWTVKVSVWIPCLSRWPTDALTYLQQPMIGTFDDLDLEISSGKRLEHGWRKTHLGW